MRTIDLRSDTVTRPSADMRAAIAAAEVGDDVLEKDPTVGRLEEHVAELLGKEAALFVPSGTMANQIALRRHCQPGHEVIVERGAHVLNYESGAGGALAGVVFYPLDGYRGTFTPDELQAAIRPDVVHVPTTGLVVIENTNNTAGGTVWPLAQLEKVADAAHASGVPVHLDGARIWNASVASGDTPARIARTADTVSVAISKGLGAPVGSLLAGSRELIEPCWVLRKQMGGGMRQSGLLAAGCLYALEHNMEKLAEDHANARLLAEGLDRIPGVDVDLEAAQTNIVFFDVSGAGHDAPSVASTCDAKGVRMVPFSPTSLRAVTHLDVNADDIDHACRVIAEVLGSPVPSERA